MRPARHVALLAALTLLVAACGGTATQEPSADPLDTAPPSAFGSLPVESAAPSVLPSGSATATPSAAPSDAIPSGSPDVESQVPGSADACTGTDANREFFVAATGALDWTVYCATLPSGWFVDVGEYRQASGGRVEISYRGPSGARLELHQGAFCGDPDGCVPPGTDAGEAVFGDMNGALVSLDDGGWAIVVDRGAAISWLAIVHGTDEAAARALAEGLIPVDA
jgi:hypothetical protein